MVRVKCVLYTSAKGILTFSVGSIVWSTGTGSIGWIPGLWVRSQQ